MSRFILRRVVQAIPTFIGITIISFALMRLAPGDPVNLLAAGVADMSPADLAVLRHSYGLDQPVPVQYLIWLQHIFTGDFGKSFLYQRPVLQMITQTLPNTLQLSVAALLVALAVGIPLGIVAARYRGSLLDQVIRVVGVAGHAVPTFWLGLLFILILSVEVRLFPIGGMLTIGASEWDLGDRFRHLVGPVLALSFAGIANYSRYMRTEMLEVLAHDFVRASRAKGLPESSVLTRHALRNALIPMITALGGLLANLVSGALVIEQVFAWPGMGRMTYEAARSKDYPVIMGVVVVSSLLLLVSYILRDVAYGVADPRVRL